jgi:hypothetical protein
MSRSQRGWTKDVVLARLKAQATIDSLGARVPATTAAGKIELARIVGDIESGRLSPAEATARFNAVTTRVSHQDAA